MSDWWNVTFHAAPTRDDEEGVVTLEAIEALLDGINATASFEPGRFTVSMWAEGEKPGIAVGDAYERWSEACVEAGLPPWQAVRIEIATEQELIGEVERPNAPELLGVAELAELLGVSKQRASELARSSTFPAPVAELASGPVWLAPSVSRYVAEWQRRPGRRSNHAAEASG